MTVGSAWPRRGGHGTGDVPGALCAARGVRRACSSSSAAVWGSLELGLLCWGEGHAGLGPPHLPGPEPQVLVCGTQVLGPPSRQLPGAPGSLSRHSGGCGGRGAGSGGPWPVPTGPLPLLLLVLSLWPPRSLRRNLKPEPGLGPLPWRASGDPRPHRVAFRCRGLFTRGCAHGRLREASCSAEQGQGELKLPHRLPSSFLPRAANSLCEERDKGLSRQGREQTAGRGLRRGPPRHPCPGRPSAWHQPAQPAPGLAPGRPGLGPRGRVPSPESRLLLGSEPRASADAVWGLFRVSSTLRWSVLLCLPGWVLLLSLRLMVSGSDPLWHLRVPLACFLDTPVPAPLSLGFCELSGCARPGWGLGSHGRPFPRSPGQSRPLWAAAWPSPLLAGPPSGPGATQGRRGLTAAVVSRPVGEWCPRPSAGCTCQSE